LEADNPWLNLDVAGKASEQKGLNILHSGFLPERGKA
jgi:hypothetical protein